MSETLAERSTRVVTPALPRFGNTEIERGQGVYLYGADGKTYLDFASGIAVMNTGHGHPKVLAAAHAQIDRLVHVCVHVSWHEPYVRLAEKLAELVPSLGMAFFANSGTEAIEAALKMARYVTRRPAIIAFEGSFHGRTLGAASLTGKASLRRHYEPLLPAIYHVPYPWCYRCSYGQKREACHFECYLAIERLFETLVHPEETAAIFIEPILGEGGYNVPPDEFLLKLRTLCDRYNILLIVDEVQTGMGRTGKMFAWQHIPNFEPDAMVLAKALGSGFPIGALLGRPKWMSQWEKGAHGSTFGGNPVSCAAALATIDVIQEEKLLDNATKIGAFIYQGLKDIQAQFACVGDVRGRGMMLAMEFIKPDGSPDGDLVREVISACEERGLVIPVAGRYGNILRIIPPLTITQQQAADGVAIIKEAIRSKI